MSLKKWGPCALAMVAALLASCHPCGDTCIVQTTGIEALESDRSEFRPPVSSSDTGVSAELPVVTLTLLDTNGVTMSSTAISFAWTESQALVMVEESVFLNADPGGGMACSYQGRVLADVAVPVSWEGDTGEAYATIEADTPVPITSDLAELELWDGLVLKLYSPRWSQC